MARPRSNSPRQKGKGTSFGKKSDAEKSFRKRSSGSRSGRGEFKPASGPYQRPSGEGSAPAYRSKPAGTGFRRSDDGTRREGPSGKAPFRKESGDSFGTRKPNFGKGGLRNDRTERGGKREGGSFRPRSEGSSKFARPYRSDGDQVKRPYRKSDSSSFDARSSRGEYKKPFRQTDGFSKSERPKGGVSGPDQEREKKPFRKTEGPSFNPKGERQEFKKPFRKTDDSSRAEGSERGEHSEDREKAPFQKKDRKSFVQSRVVTSADFTKPGRKETAIKTETAPKDEGLTRLNKYIANAGVGSRRQADELIAMGLISVNGTAVTTLGTKVKPGDVVRYEDRVLKAEKLVYILLNKPKGFITTTDDPQERNTVMAIVASACKERIYPVGRLDRNTTGLLLLTNDGDLADKLTHPSYKAKKVYKVELDRPLTKNDFKKIMEGVHLEEGRAMVDDLAIISEDDKTVGLEIHIGWNRVVRRIFETLGYDVVRLDRSVFAGMDKKDLSRGQWRFLKPEEVVRLKHFK